MDNITPEFKQRINTFLKEVYKMNDSRGKFYFGKELDFQQISLISILNKKGGEKK
jgi:hypothetical protein